MKKIYKIVAALAVLALAISAIPSATPAQAWFGTSGPGLHVTTLIAGQNIDAGTVRVWNSREKLHIQVDPTGGWQINTIQVYVGAEPVPTVLGGNPVPGQFPYKKEYSDPASSYTLVLDLVDDLGMSWGEPYEDLRIQNIAVHADLVKIVLDEDVDKKSPDNDKEEGKKPRVLEKEGAWAFGDGVFDGGRWAWWFKYEITHPQRGHFVDSPVGGLKFETPTSIGKTDESGGFDYFPGERVDLYLGSVYLGSPLAGHKTSPLDIYEDADTDDPRVINMARFLQSLDVDGDSKEGILITEEVEACLNATLIVLGLEEVDFFIDDAQTEAVIQGTIDECAGVEGVTLLAVSAEEAQAELDATLSTDMFRKDISRTDDLTSSKSKLNIMTVWFPALKANGEPASYMDGEESIPGVPYYDSEGNLLRTELEAKPVVVVYTDGVEETGNEDIFAAISRDDGNTFKRMNLSRAADRSSFELENGEDAYGQAKKPVFQIRGNNIMVAWTSKFCSGGKPAYAIDPEDDYLLDDPYYTPDIWGVGGPQRSVDYADQGFPEVGEVPYSCVWVARGVIVTQGMINSGGFWVNPDGDTATEDAYVVGDIVWFKPERLTSGRRDANQVFMGASDGAGFAIAWQEDPDGLRPGNAAGPGPGWGGATTNHKTDIWYSYVTWADFRKIDMEFESGGDPEHLIDVVGRPKALVPMSLPVRLSDNDAVNTDNLLVELGGDGLPVVDTSGNFIPSNGMGSIADISYTQENLTRCVKFEEGETIVEVDSTDAATYHVLPALPEDHSLEQNCTSCHVPFDLQSAHDAPTQGSPIPLVVVNSLTPEYLGGFTNTDCASCHYSNVVPRDRVIAVTPGLNDDAKISECESNGGIWKEELEAYYPYDGYPYVASIVDSDASGTHAYGYEIPGLCDDFYTYTNYSDAEKSVCITEDGRLLDGNTGAARANLFLQTYTNNNGTPTDTSDDFKSAFAIMAYEESKGAGVGPPERDTEDPAGHFGDAPLPEAGKIAIYHSFDFQNPDLVSAGTIINLPEMDADGNIMYLRDVSLDAEGELVYGALRLDYLGQPQLAYENARRPRFIIQGKAGAGDSKTVLLILYKEGPEGMGRPSDIMLRRVVASAPGNPYATTNIACNEWEETLNGLTVCVDGAQNMSSVTPTVTVESTGEPTSEDPYGAIKVVEWEQTVDNLSDPSWLNPLDDARAHRGGIRGDFIVMGYSYTPNWAASRNGNDKYDFLVRRSFDGGLTWTTDPAGSGVEHCKTWTYPVDGENPGEKIEECTFYPAGTFEEARNLSQLPNSKESVIEPRIVPAPGTIKVDGVWTGRDEDMQNPAVFYVSYGTATNPGSIHGDSDEEEEGAAPLDLYYSFSTDRGESFVEVTWLVNPDSDGTNAGTEVTAWDWLAKGDGEQGEAQLRMTPDGSRFYATWLQDEEDSSDIMFRRIMSPEFLANVLAVPE